MGIEYEMRTTMPVLPSTSVAAILLIVSCGKDLTGKYPGTEAYNERFVTMSSGVSPMSSGSGRTRRLASVQGQKLFALFVSRFASLFASTTFTVLKSRFSRLFDLSRESCCCSDAVTSKSARDGLSERCDTMAKVATPSLDANRSIYNSILGQWPKSVAQRSNREHQNAPIDVATIRTTLFSELSAAVGLDGETFVYGVETLINNGFNFRIPIDDCAPMSAVRTPNDDDERQQKAMLSRMPLWASVRQWQTKLGTDHLKKVLADVFDQILSRYVIESYAKRYRDDVVDHLSFWVRHVFAGAIQFALDQVSNTKNTVVGYDMSARDLRRWHDTAMTKFGALRVDELFSVITNWDDRDDQAIQDLRRFITSPSTRTYLTENFLDVMSSRLLHPGASTIETLQFYISIIKVFRKLDPKGVLLDKVARRIRRYLRERDDTIKVIVGGLLSDPFNENGRPVPSNPDTLSELAQALSAKDHMSAEAEDNELDWDNMEWMPDPVDAAPDYMKSKNADVVGSLTSLFESKEVFIRELQTTLADRLLKNKPDFNLEIGVISHLKMRFGESALQGCEVMLRDVLESRKVDYAIQTEGKLHEARAAVDGADALIHAKILSRLFWPSMGEQTFNLPDSIAREQKAYEKVFESLKHSRKLNWLNSLGQVEVELDFEDRSITEEVAPYQATVIYAFQEQNSTRPVSKTVTELAEQLEMSPTLVRSACIFWLSKRVLHSTSTPDKYIVIDRLSGFTGDVDMSDAPVSVDQGTSQQVAAAEQAAATAEQEAMEADKKAKMAVYQQFIISMLTNQGAMPIQRIHMMLGIVVPGGFPFSQEELKDFMAGMVKEGALERGAGGNYKATT